MEVGVNENKEIQEIQELSDEELEGITGGLEIETGIWWFNERYEVWCPRCGSYNLKLQSQTTLECLKCGLIKDAPNMETILREWPHQKL